MHAGIVTKARDQETDQETLKEKKERLRAQAIQAFVYAESPGWLTAGIVAVSLCYGLLIFLGNGYTDDHGKKRGVEMAVMYLPFMFATFAAVIAGFTVYGKKDVEYEEEFNIVCFKAGGLMLGLAMLGQASAQLYSLKHKLVGIPLGIAMLVTFVAIAWAALKRWNISNPRPRGDWIIFLRTIIFIITAALTLIAAPAWILFSLK